MGSGVTSMKPLGDGALVDSVGELEPLRNKAAPRLFEDEMSHGGFEIPIDDGDRR